MCIGYLKLRLVERFFNLLLIHQTRLLYFFIYSEGSLKRLSTPLTKRLKDVFKLKVLYSNNKNINLHYYSFTSLETILCNKQINNAASIYFYFVTQFIVTL